MKLFSYCNKCGETELDLGVYCPKCGPTEVKPGLLSLLVCSILYAAIVVVIFHKQIFLTGGQV